MPAQAQRALARPKPMPNLLARPVPKNIIICSVCEKPHWKHDRQSLREVLVTDYKLPHIKMTIKVYGLSRHGCASSHHPGENVNNLRAVSEDRTFLSKIRPLCGAVDEWFSVRDSKPFVCFCLQRGSAPQCCRIEVVDRDMSTIGFCRRRPESFVPVELVGLRWYLSGIRCCGAK